MLLFLVYTLQVAISALYLYDGGEVVNPEVGFRNSTFIPKFDSNSNLLKESIPCSPQKNGLQECIPVGCVPPACCPYLPACTALGGVPGPGGYLVQVGYLVPWGFVPGPVGVYLVPGGVPGPGGIPDPRGVPGPEGGTCPGTPPTVNRILDTRF